MSRLRLLRSADGQASAIFALAAVTVFSVASLSLDAGRAYVATQQIKSAADSAALAGAQNLPGDPGDAASVAVSTAEQNGIAAGDVTVSLSRQDTVITVTTHREVPFYFAPLFGVDSGSFTQTSAAQVGPIDAMTGVVPLGVFWQDFAFGQTYTLKVGSGDGSDGNYGALALGGNGASTYEQNLQDGYPTELTAGQTVSTETGNMVGPTQSGLSTRVAAGQGYTWQTVPLDNPAVVYVPVVTPPGSGKDQVTVVGFAAFFLTQASAGSVQGVFLDTVTTGQFGSGTNYGLQAERLIE